MHADMATLQMCTAWSSDARLCIPPLDCKIALPVPSPSSSSVSFSSSSSSSYPSSSSLSSLTSPGRCWHRHSTRRRDCRVTAIAPPLEYYHIPYTEGVPVGSKLKVFNLPYNCDRDALAEHFRSCDAVVENLEITNNEEEQNASGYVVLEDLDQACAAVAQLDGARFQGKCVRMDFVERRPYEKRNPNKTRSRHKSTPKTVNKIFIGNLPWRVDSTTLEQLFSAHGTVHEAQVMRDRLNGRSLGYGFVVMSDAVEVQKAIAALDGCEVEGRPLRVNMAISRAPLQANS